MTETPSDEPTPEDLEIALTVRRIDSLDLDPAGFVPTVLEPFSGLLFGGSVGSTAPGALGGGEDLDRPGGPLPELSYLTLRPLVIRELRERLAARSRTGADPQGLSADAPDTVRSETGEPDGPTDASRLTVREFITRTREASVPGGSPESTPDHPTGSVRNDPHEAERRRAGPEPDYTGGFDASRGPTGSTGDESIDPTDLERPGHTESPSRPTLGGVATGDGTDPHPADPEPYRETGFDSEPAQPSPASPPSLEVRTGPESSTFLGRTPTTSADPSDGSWPDRSPGSERTDRDAPWGSAPRTVVLDRGVAVAGDADGDRTRSLADAAPPDGNGPGPSARRQRSDDDTERAGEPGRSSAERPGKALEEEVASSVATMDGEPFERFVDRLSRELDRKERIERERRGL